MAENETQQLAQYTTETLIALADKIDDPQLAALRDLHKEVSDIRNCIVHINDALIRLDGKKEKPFVKAAITSIYFDLIDLSKIAYGEQTS